MMPEEVRRLLGKALTAYETERAWPNDDTLLADFAAARAWLASQAPVPNAAAPEPESMDEDEWIAQAKHIMGEAVRRGGMHFRTQSIMLALIDTPMPKAAATAIAQPAAEWRPVEERTMLFEDETGWGLTLWLERDGATLTLLGQDEDGEEVLRQYDLLDNLRLCRKQEAT